MSTYSFQGVSNFPYDPETHEARLMCSDPVAVAFQWMVEYAKNLADQCDSEDSYGTVTVADLLEAADSHQPENGSRWGGDYISRGGAFEGQSVDPTFWAMYAKFRQKPLEDVEEAHFFSCSC